MDPRMREDGDGGADGEQYELDDRWIVTVRNKIVQCSVQTEYTV